MGFILKDQKLSLVWFGRHHRFIAVLTSWPFSLLAHHTETSLSWQFWPPEKKYERRIKHHFLTNKNVFGLEGEGLFVNLYFFCIASRQAELALSLTKIWFFLWGPGGGIFYFCKHFIFRNRFCAYHHQPRGLFAGPNFVCERERFFLSYCIYVKH